MKKFIAILILAAAPVVFAQESKASSLKANSKTTEQVDQEKKEAIAAEKQRQVASQKEADAKAAEGDKHVVEVAVEQSEGEVANEEEVAEPILDATDA